MSKRGNLDFFSIGERTLKKGCVEIYPEFNVERPKDIMIRGGSFYAIWDPEANLWSTDEYDVARLVDKDLNNYAKERNQTFEEGTSVSVKRLKNYSTRGWSEFKNYIANIADNYKALDRKITFLNTDTKREDYATKRLSYNLNPNGSFKCYEKLMDTIYEPGEKQKLEWAIGSVFTGDSKDLQKFIVLYGESGAGKSTFLNILKMLFEDYCTSFDAKALGMASDQFSTEAFKNNPLVAIQHDGDLSRIEDNTKLNSITSHEEIIINEKRKSRYPLKIDSFLFMGTNKPVKITDAKSGIIRRLIDVQPTGRKVDQSTYKKLMATIPFELGAIASHCIDVYKELGPFYYDDYVSTEMIFKTDMFFNFVEDCYDVFKTQNKTTLSAAYAMYKEYCEDSGAEYKLPRYKFREELKNYFDNFELRMEDADGRTVRSLYTGFKFQKFDDHRNKKPGKGGEPEDEAQNSVKEDGGKAESEVGQVGSAIDIPDWLNLTSKYSLLDEVLADQKAQYAREDSHTPTSKWINVKNTLSRINSRRLHFVLCPLKLICIDFDLRDKSGKKDRLLNLKAASKWPKTYAEYSKSGEGLHLHYWYEGDPLELMSIFEPGIEIKVFNGEAALRRMVSLCNDIPIATISGGLPVKEKKVVNKDVINDEIHLRNLIEKALRKEIHPNTRPSIDFIAKVLDEAYESGMTYDVSNLRSAVLAFAQKSTNQKEYCVTKYLDMKFKSESRAEPVKGKYADDRLVFFDIEVFPNLLLIVWKFMGAKTLYRMFNPSPQEIESLFQYKLVGFNNRRYDNHILYAGYIGYSNERIFQTSKNIIDHKDGAFFGEAYNISYTDVYDFASASNKMSLKKWEINLHIHHQELGLPWDQPVDQSKWEEVARYCEYDVLATEAVFNHLKGDYTARLILAELSGMTPNDTSNAMSARFIFGNNKNPQNEFVYTDLSKEFPTYRYDPKGIPKEEYAPGAKIVSRKSIFEGEDPSEGGHAWGNPGIYRNVGLFDVASMHPSSIENLNLFGDRYTKRFSEIKQARIYIKHKDLDKLKEMFDGALVKYLDDPEALDGLSDALKTVINSVYGLTSASFPNEFKDPRNIDNIVAKRGALFMIHLKHQVQAKGYTVVHVKTDSIKVENPDQEITDFIFSEGKKYGYNFEHEATYDRMCIVNDSVYIAKYDSQGIRNKGGKHANEWTATGDQFKEPYVLKSLFTKEPLEFWDLCQTFSVSTSLYLDMNEKLVDVTAEEDELTKIQTKLKKGIDIPDAEQRIKELKEQIAKGHDYKFVGKVGSFCPIVKGKGGGELYRENHGSYSYANGSKNYRWLESETVQQLGYESNIDMGYFNSLAEAAKDQIKKYGSYEEFIA